MGLLHHFQRSGHRSYRCSRRWAARVLTSKLDSQLLCPPTSLPPWCTCISPDLAHDAGLGPGLQMGLLYANSLWSGTQKRRSFFAYKVTIRKARLVAGPPFTQGTTLYGNTGSLFRRTTSLPGIWWSTSGRLVVGVWLNNCN